MNKEARGRPDESMTLITELMQHPLDPGYAVAAQQRQESGLPPATWRHSPLLIIVAVLIGALLGASAFSLRTPATGASTIKAGLVNRIEAGRARIDAQTRVILNLRNQINVAQAAALTQQSRAGLTAELAELELVAGTVPVRGPGLVLTIDDASTNIEPDAADVNPRTATEPDQGKVTATDLQIVVNGLWSAGAEAISINGHRLTSRAAIRSAGEAILVNYRPLTRPYVTTAIGDPGSLSVEFADNSGGSYLQSLKNYQVRIDIQNRASVLIPGEPTLTLDKARALRSAVTSPVTTGPPADGGSTATQAPSQPTPRTTETTQ